MVDTSVLTGHITDYIAAVGGLGTAAFGLVDATKAVKGGISRAGFDFIQGLVNKLVGASGGSGGAPCFGRVDMIETLRANWINGVDIAQQKAAAKALIRLYLDPSTAPQLETATGVTGLVNIATKLQGGQTLDTTELAILGRFDALVSAAIDEGYERADQKYRNFAKLLAAVFAIVLSFFGGWIAFAGGWLVEHPAVPLMSYLGSMQMFLSILVGAIAVPLAPVAKDITSTLQAAVKALAR